MIELYYFELLKNMQIFEVIRVHEIDSGHMIRRSDRKRDNF